jgi:EAL domain
MTLDPAPDLQTLQTQAREAVLSLIARDLETARQKCDIPNTRLLTSLQGALKKNTIQPKLEPVYNLGVDGSLEHYAECLMKVPIHPDYTPEDMGNDYDHVGECCKSWSILKNMEPDTQTAFRRYFLLHNAPIAIKRPISINVSGDDINDETYRNRFKNDICAILNAAKLQNEPLQLTLEMTETVRCDEDIIRFLGELCRDGIHLALDDYGAHNCRHDATTLQQFTDKNIPLCVKLDGPAIVLAFREGNLDPLNTAVQEIKNHASTATIVAEWVQDAKEAALLKTAIEFLSKDALKLSGVQSYTIDSKNFAQDVAAVPKDTTALLVQKLQGIQHNR